jgi:hypothetical protein
LSGLCRDCAQHTSFAGAAAPTARPQVKASPNNKALKSALDSGEMKPKLTMNVGYRNGV